MHSPMANISAFMALMPTEDVATQAIERLKTAGYEAKRIKTAAAYRHMSGPTVGWCATNAGKQQSFLASKLGRLFQHSSITVEEAVRVSGIPEYTLLRYRAATDASKFIILVYGDDEGIAQGLEIVQRYTPIEIDFFHK